MALICMSICGLEPRPVAQHLIKGDRVLDEKGRTSFLISDEHEREAASLVVLDDDGRVLAHRVLTVGAE